MIDNKSILLKEKKYFNETLQMFMIAKVYNFLIINKINSIFLYQFLLNFYLTKDNDEYDKLYNPLNKILKLIFFFLLKNNLHKNTV